MPYNMKKDGNQWCVYNSDTGEKKGCSDSRKKSVAHMRALYAVEGGSEMGKKETSEAEFLNSVHNYEVEFSDVVPADELETKEWSAEGVEYMPYTFATSFDELEQQRKAREEQMRIEGLIGTFPVLANNVMASPEIDPSSKAAAIEELAGELVERIKSVGDGEDDDMEMKAISEREDVSDADKKRAVGEYGNVTYADPKNKKYPIDTEAHIRSAWSYIGMPKNQKKYSPAEVAAIKRRIVAAWKRVIDKKGPQGAEKGLSLIISKLKEVLSSFDIDDGLEYDETKMMVWKEGDTWMWVARYSNNFRDNDNPPEIIAARSHRRFVENVEKGLAPYPELWLWHVKEWKSGQSTWVGYDESGIAMAAGYFYPWASSVAEWLSKQDDFAVSHGMPPETIVYEDGDVIVEHETREISPLPGWSAANKHTGFVSFRSFIKEESEMAIPKDQKEKLVKAMGLPEAAIAAIEKANAAVAKEASDSGLESKEGDAAAPAVAEVVTEPLAGESTPPAPVEGAKPVEGQEEAEPEVKEVSLSVKEIAEAVAAVLNPYAERVDALEKSVAELSEKFSSVGQLETKAAEAIANTSPVASLVAMITNRAVGSPAAQVKEGDPLADSKPKEAADNPAEARTGIPFIDTILSQK